LPRLDRHAGAERVSLEKLLRRSDVCVAPLPAHRGNAGLINAARLNLMNPQRWCCQHRPGPLVVESDLAAALNEGRSQAPRFDVLSVNRRPPTIRC